MRGLLVAANACGDAHFQNVLSPSRVWKQIGVVHTSFLNNAALVGITECTACSLRIHVLLGASISGPGCAAPRHNSLFGRCLLHSSPRYLDMHADAVVTLPDSIFTAVTASCSCALFAPPTPYPWPEVKSVEPKSPSLCKARLHGSDKALYRNVAIDYHGSGMLVQPLDIEEVRHSSRVEQSLMRRGGLLFVANVAASACVEQGKRLSGLFPFTSRFSTHRPIMSLPSESPFLLDRLGSSLSVLA
jgi:hypothetical protein